MGNEEPPKKRGRGKQPTRGHGTARLTKQRPPQQYKTQRTGRRDAPSHGSLAGFHNNYWSSVSRQEPRVKLSIPSHSPQSPEPGKLSVPLPDDDERPDIGFLCPRLPCSFAVTVQGGQDTNVQDAEQTVSPPLPAPLCESPPRILKLHNWPGGFRVASGPGSAQHCSSRSLLVARLRCTVVNCIRVRLDSRSSALRVVVLSLLLRFGDPSYMMPRSSLVRGTSMGFRIHCVVPHVSPAGSP